MSDGGVASHGAGGWPSRAGLVRSDEELLRDYHRSRDRRVRDLLVERHMGVALWCARRFEDRGERLEDLRQEALLALVSALERFDPDRDVSFVTFAVPTIFGSLRRHLRDRAYALRLPRRLIDARPIVPELLLFAQ